MDDTKSSTSSWTSKLRLEEVQSKSSLSHLEAKEEPTFGPSCIGSFLTHEDLEVFKF